MSKFNKWEALRDYLKEGAEYDRLGYDVCQAYQRAYDKMSELDEIEKRMVSTLKPGDKVRHKNDKDIGTGIVKDIAKSGVRAYVDFGEIDDWNRKRLNWKPYPAYYRIDLLEIVEVVE